MIEEMSKIININNLIEKNNNIYLKKNQKTFIYLDHLIV